MLLDCLSVCFLSGRFGVLRRGTRHRRGSVPLPRMLTRRAESVLSRSRSRGELLMSDMCWVCESTSREKPPRLPSFERTGCLKSVAHDVNYLPPSFDLSLRPERVLAHLTRQGFEARRVGDLLLCRKVRIAEEEVRPDGTPIVAADQSLAV